MTRYANARVVGSIVFANPLNEWGSPYINQWLPVRRANLMERIAAMFGFHPKVTEE